MITAASSLGMPPPEVSFEVSAVVLGDANPTGAHTQFDAGRVCYENSGYRITIGDDDTILVQNKATGEEYLASAPPQVVVDGDLAFQFYGTTTLELADGTKVTITTSPWAEDPTVTISDKVTITNADYGVEVMGLASCTAGDLHFIETYRYGWLLDATVGDGNTVAENTAGAGFVGNQADGTWQVVDEAYIQATDLALLGELAGDRGKAFLSLSSLLAITFIGAFRGPMAYRFSELEDNVQVREFQQPDADRDAKELRLRLARDGPRLAWYGWGAP